MTEIATTTYAVSVLLDCLVIAYLGYRLNLEDKPLTPVLNIAFRFALILSYVTLIMATSKLIYWSIKLGSYAEHLLGG